MTLDTFNSLVNKKMTPSLVDVSIAGLDTEFGRICTGHSQTFFYLIFRLYQNKGVDVRINRSEMADVMHCSIHAITNRIKRLEELELITVDRQVTSINGSVRTINHYNINWKRSWERLGNTIFGMSSGGKYAFIRKSVTKVLETIKSMLQTCVHLVHTIIPISFNKEIYINRISNNFSNSSKKIRAFVKNPLTVEPDIPISGTTDSQELINRAVTYLNDQINHMPLTEGPMEPTYFDKTITTCPDKWRQLALDLEMKEMYIDRNFEEFREYWLIQGKIKKALKSNWALTWKNRIEDVLKHHRTSYMKVNPNYNFQLLAPSKAPSSDDFPNSQTRRPAGGVAYAFTKVNVMPESWKEIFIRTKMHTDHMIDIYDKFKNWYSEGKGAMILEYEEGWEKKWSLWLSRSMDKDYLFIPKKGFAMSKSYGKETECDIDILSTPEHLKPIHNTLISELSKPLYISWIQPGVLTQKEEGGYTIQYSNSFIRDHVRSNFMIQKSFKDNYIEVI